MTIDVRSRLRDVDPRLRLSAAAAACCAAVSSGSLRTPALLFAFGCAGLRMQRVPARALLRSLAAVAWMGGLAVALKLALTPGAPLFASAAFPVRAITREGAWRAAELAARILAAAAWLRWLVSAASPAEITAALAGLGAPRALVELLIFTHRFVEVLQRTATSAYSAAAMRAGFARPRTAARTAGMLAGLVILRMVDRSERVADAMRLRGYRGELPIPAPRRGERRTNFAFAAIAGAALTLSLAVGGAP